MTRIIALLVIALPWRIGAQPAFEAVRIPHTQPGVTLTAKVVIPAGPGPHPVLIFNHGFSRVSGPPDYPALAELMREHGIATVFPMRRGIGGSGGEPMQPQTCDVAANQMGVAHALEDVEASLAYVRRRPEFDGRRVLIGGNSRGGVLALMAATMQDREHAPLGLINFVGIWMGKPNCPSDAIDELLFGEASRGRPLPQLWLYASRDGLYSRPMLDGLLRPFTQAGHGVRLHFYDVDFWNGHKLLENGRHFWAGDVKAFLKERGLASPP